MIRMEVHTTTGNGNAGRTGYDDDGSYMLRSLPAQAALTRLLVGLHESSPAFGRQHIWKTRTGPANNATVKIKVPLNGQEAKMVQNGSVSLDSIDRSRNNYPNSQKYVDLETRAVAALMDVECDFVE